LIKTNDIDFRRDEIIMVLEFCDLCHKKEPNRRFKIKMSTTRLKEIADISQTATLTVNKGE
jgi:hypothetical protein